MADRTLTINHADGGSETYTINRDKFAGVRVMTVDGETVSVDRTAVPKEQAKETTFGGSQSITVKRDIDPLLSKVVGGAAAAYSLRDLNDVLGNSNKVVRVRRSSDNAEKDFTALQISTGEMTNWVNSQIVPPLDIGVETADGRPSVPEGGTSIGTPAAAYSLRSLGEGQADDIVPSGDTVTPAAGAYVVQVRRSSDDAVKSFTASEVADGTLEDWVNEQLNLTSELNPTPVGADATWVYTAIDDSNYDLEAINNSETKILKLKNSVFKGNTKYRFTFDYTVISGTSNLSLKRNVPFKTESISEGFNSIELDVTANSIIQFNSTAGATFQASIRNLTVTAIESDGYVSTWYDQSGNDNHATQTDNASQPKIVDAGTYLGEIDFPSSTATLGFSNITCGTTYSFFCALPRLDVSNFKILSDGGAAPRIDFERGSPDRIEVVDNNYGFKKFNTHNNFVDDDNLTSIINASTSVNVFYNGNASSTNPFTIPNANTFNTLGGQAAGGAYEVILYTSDQSANRTALEANIGEYYGISGIPAYDNTVDGFVETWYDQSGNGNDAFQTVTASQPKIVDAGTYLGHLLLDGTDDYLDLTTNLTAQPYSTFSVYSATQNTSYIYSGGTLPVAGRRSTGVYIMHHGTVLVGGTHPSTEILGTYFANGASSEIFSNGTSVVSGDAGNTYNTIGYVFGRPSDAFGGTASELIIYNSDQSSNRTAIEANINNHYSIY